MKRTLVSILALTALLVFTGCGTVSKQATSERHTTTPELSTAENIAKLKVGLTEIKVTTLPTKINYYYIADPETAEDFDPAGIVVTGYYNNGVQKDLTQYVAIDSSAYDKTSEAEYAVVVTLDEYGTEFYVNVWNVAVESLEITTPPNKIAYFVGDTFDPAGMVIKATYNNGDVAENVNYICNTTVPFTSLADNTISVTYGGYEATFVVNVREIVSISVVNNSLKGKTGNPYYDGDTLDITNLIVTAIISDGTTEEISIDLSNCSSIYLSSEGILSGGSTAAPNGISRTITVTVGDKTTTFSVYVKKLELSSISITQLPNNLLYTPGSLLDLNGLLITSRYNNTVTQDETSAVTISPYDESAIGQHTVTVNLNGKRAYFKIGIYDNPSGRWLVENNSALSITESVRSYPMTSADYRTINGALTLTGIAFNDVTIEDITGTSYGINASRVNLTNTAINNIIGNNANGSIYINSTSSLAGVSIDNVSSSGANPGIVINQKNTLDTTTISNVSGGTYGIRINDNNVLSNIIISDVTGNTDAGVYTYGVQIGTAIGNTLNNVEFRNIVGGGGAGNKASVSLSNGTTYLNNVTFNNVPRLVLPSTKKRYNGNITFINCTSTTSGTPINDKILTYENGVLVNVEYLNSETPELNYSALNQYGE